MILTSECILENIEKKNIVIEPFNADQLNPNSYDVRLDNKLQIYTRNEYAFAHEYNSDDILVQQFQHQNYVESKCCCDEQTIYYIDAKKPNATEEIIIPEEGYILVPGILYLGSTVEYTETHNIVPTIEGKSSIGRLGIDIHKTAGFGDLSFCGKWTLEITVTQPVKIYPYMKLAQIIYHEISGKVGKTYNGKYQGQQGVIASKAHEDFEKKTYCAFFADEYLSGFKIGQKLDLTVNGKVICKQAVTKIDGNNVYFEVPNIEGIDFSKIQTSSHFSASGIESMEIR